MNLNHDPDKHLLEQIDQLMDAKQPTGHAMLDELAATRPVSRSAFQNALEERLLAQLAAKNQGETPMVTSTNPYLPMPAPRRNWLPLTLLAAMIAIAIAGLLFINGRGKSPMPNEMALAADTHTPTATVPSTVAVVPPANPSVHIPGVGNVSPVVVAVRDIPRGTVLSSQWLAIIYSGDDTRGMYSDKEAVRGLIAQRDIPRWQPILPVDISDQPAPTSQPTLVPVKMVKIVVALQNLPRGYTFPDGDTSDVAGYTNWPADSVPGDALQFNDETANIANLWGKMLQVNVTIGQPILSTMLGDGLKNSASNSTSDYNYMANRVAVAVPLASLTSDSLVPGVGGSVDIVALLPFKANSKNVNGLIANGLRATPVPDGHYIMETMLIRDSLVLFRGTWPQVEPTTEPSLITFAISADDSGMLAWLAEQPDVKFRLQKPLPNVFSLPVDARIITIPIENVTSTENIQPGYVVNVYSTCAFVPDVVGMNNTVISAKADCSQAVDENRATNVSVFDGEIVVSGRQPVMTYDSIALAVPPDKVLMFNQLVEGGMHFKLVPATNDSQPSPTPIPVSSPTMSATSTPAPEQTAVPTPDVFSSEINIRRDHLIMNGEMVTRGDNVNITAVCAFIPETKDSNNLTIPAKMDCSQKTETQVVSAGIVLIEFNLLPSGTDATLSIAVFSSEAAQIQPMIDAGMVFKLAKTANPSTHTIFDIPLEVIDSVSEPLQLGDPVDVYSTCLETSDSSSPNVTSPKADCTQSVEEHLTTGSVVSMNSKTLSLAVPNYEQGRLSDMIITGMHFKLVKAVGVEQSVPPPTLVPLPSGEVSVDIPIAIITSTVPKDKLKAGDYVDVIVSFKGIDVGSRAPAEFQKLVTPQPLQPDGTMTQRVVQSALILNSGFTLTLAVSPDEAKVIQWILSAKLPITLRSITPVVTGGSNTAPFTLQLPLDSASRWATDDLQVGDKVDVVMGFVSGSGDALSLDFKPYGTLSWLDAASKGEVSYPIYSPTVVKTGAEVMPGARGASAIFIHRIIQNAEVTAINTYIDPTSGRMSTLNVILEIGVPMTADNLNVIQGYIQAGMPYLVVKH